MKSHTPLKSTRLIVKLVGWYMLQIPSALVLECQKLFPEVPVVALNPLASERPPRIYHRFVVDVRTQLDAVELREGLHSMNNSIRLTSLHCLCFPW